MDADTLPQTIAVIATRAEPLGIEVVIVDLDAGELPAELLRCCTRSTRAPPARSATTPRVIERRTQRGALVTVAADLLALTPAPAPG